MKQPFVQNKVLQRMVARYLVGIPFESGDVTYAHDTHTDGQKDANTQEPFN